MSVTAVTPPTPPNGDLDRAMFTWIPTVGATYDPLSSDSHMQSFLNWCSSNGVSIAFLDIWLYLGGGNWTSANAAQVQKLLHFAHASGIKVFALCGNTDWGHNQQWVMQNIIRRLEEFQSLAGNSSYSECKFDGLIFDVEYWTVGAGNYTSVEPVGLCDLVNACRRALNIPVGCFLTSWLAASGSEALTITYYGDTGLEGLVISHQCDFVAVACYLNTATGQEGDLQPWYNDASETGVGHNVGLFCTALTDSGQSAGTSYWTGVSGAKAAMETAQTSIASSFKPASPNATNCAFRGAAIEQYSSYAQMT